MAWRKKWLLAVLRKRCLKVYGGLCGRFGRRANQSPDAITPANPNADLFSLIV